MATKEFPAGTLLIRREQNINALYYIASGSVRANFPGGAITLKKGDVIGACELSGDTHRMNYRTLETTEIATYPVAVDKLLESMLASPQLTQAVLRSMANQLSQLMDSYQNTLNSIQGVYQYLQNSYNAYQRLCSICNLPMRSLPGQDDVQEPVQDERLESWLKEYYQQMVGQVDRFSQDAPYLLSGLLMKGNADANLIFLSGRDLSDSLREIMDLLMNREKLDLFELYMDLLGRREMQGDALENVTMAMDMLLAKLQDQVLIDKEMIAERVAEYNEKKILKAKKASVSPDADEEDAEVGGMSLASLGGSGNELPPELYDSAEEILAYAECSYEFSEEFRVRLEEFRKLEDKNSSDDSAIKTRQALTRVFYHVYSRAFLKSMYEIRIPKVVQMFFNFGYVDEEIAGFANAKYLYSIVDRIPTKPKEGIYTMYQWLKAVYEGKKTPSRNEFDQDYENYVHELKVSGKITPAEEGKMLEDKEKRVTFELENLFVTGNKITFGRISTFCPVFSAHNVLRDLSAALVSAEQIHAGFEKIRSVDYGAFAREVLYTNPEGGIQKEYIDQEILPDVLLLPNVGVRGSMWQEIEGRRRNTPCRMMLPIFMLEDLNSMLIRMTGEFRWEMCKRVQGSRWNDVTEPSLTSEYFDYIQFYRKNHELSADAKDKLKLSLMKAKNSIREMFVRDYIVWILYEGSASPRMNKVARGILFKYCPFTAEVRRLVVQNPIYKEMVERYDVKQNQKRHRLDNFFKKLENAGLSVPVELQNQRAYLDR